MATLKLRIENDKFVETVGEGRYFDGFSEDRLHATGNGWEVKIRPGRNGKAGRIIAHSERQYSVGPAICHREFHLRDGIIGLAGGDVRNRYAYFRTNEFSAFLKKIGVDSVKREDPNGEFTVGGNGRISIKTDGEASTNWNSSWSDHKIVTNATWAVVTKTYNNGFNQVHSTILYTLEKNVLNLDIPAALEN